MASFLSQTSVTLHLNYVHKHIALWTHRYPQTYRLKCHGQSPTSNGENKEGSEPENVLLKMAWYGSELLGIAAAFFVGHQSPSLRETILSSPMMIQEQSIEILLLKQSKKTSKDLTSSQARANDLIHAVNGNLTYSAYEENCEFADPAGSFRGLRRFTRNCSNFGSLIEKCNMKLMKWEDFEDKGIGHWRFSCILSFPWRPILSATGYTEYYFDAQSGKVCRHMEHWNVPKMTLLKQILKPSKRISRKGAISS